MKEQNLLALLREMLKDSKKSDRETAKRLKVSQATITRTRNKLEKEGFIKTYTVVPDFTKLGYEILAFTFSKMKSYPTLEETQKIVQRAAKWVNKHPNVIFAADGEGLGGKDVIMISFHRNYSKYADFMRSYAMDWGQVISEFESFIVSLGSGYKMKPLDLKYLAEDK
ncbi:MAG: winged helix-turn-helix transcriptional regulator [Candidatus Bathyarchaeota archaeon]|jgi:DNA-binding Lrp family transcriptional regulator